MAISPAQLAANRQRATKVAADRIGCTIDEYQTRRANGESWCSGHQEWHPAEDFAPKGRDRLHTKCRGYTKADRAARQEARLEAEAEERRLSALQISWMEDYVSFLVASSLDRACADADPEWFFPDDLDGNVDPIRAGLAKAVCFRCSIADDCLTAACRRGERYGVWGGFTTDERDQIMGLRSPEWAENL